MRRFLRESSGFGLERRRGRQPRSTVRTVTAQTPVITFTHTHTCLLYSAESDWRCFRGCAIISSRGRPQDFFHGGGKFRDAKKLTFFSSRPQNADLSRGCTTFSSKKLTTFLVVTLKTQNFAVTTMHKTLYNISGGGKCPQNISFLRGRLCSSTGGACHDNGQYKPGTRLCRIVHP